jgi:hypothetical protein
MARRVLNRREMRKQADAAELVQPATEAAPEAPAAETAPRPRKTSARKKKEPPRLVARWGVFDNAMKQVAAFDYNQRGLADQKVAELTAKKANAIYFVQLVKEPMPHPE